MKSKSRGYFGCLFVVSGICATLSEKTPMGPGAPVVLGEYAWPIGLVLMGIGLFLIYTHYSDNK
jgi:hypothetical protein